jgi:hypothetical protein
MLYNPINKNQKIVANRMVIFFTFCHDLIVCSHHSFYNLLIFLPGQ